MRLLRDRSITSRDAPNPADPSDAPSRPSSQADALRPAQPAHSSAAVSSSPAPTPLPKRTQRYDEIYVLADYGHSLPEIAHQLAVPVGEVELILSLRDKR